MENQRLLDEIKDSKGYEIALLTTFNYDVGFFERSILFPLFENGTRDISVFVDSKELNKGIAKVRTCDIGHKYMVYPIEMNGSFHPKVILLLGQNQAKLFVSSANLTQNGYSFNNEIYNTFIYNNEHPENLKIINDAIGFFLELQDISFLKYDNLKSKVEKYIYYNKSSSNDELFLLHNLDKSILEQLISLTEDVKSISIFTPYYDNELVALKELKNAYPNARISVYLQKNKSKFPIKLNSTKISKIKGFNKVCNNSHFYHGKVIILKGNQHSYVLYGSANCTQSALLKTKKSGGNIECDVLEVGSINEFEAFKQQFEECSSDELNCEQLEFSSEWSSNFYYKYGILKDNLELTLGFTKKEDVRIIIDEVELDYKYESGFLKASYIIDQYLPNNPFIIQIYYGSKCEEIVGWYINPVLLESNRQIEGNDDLDNYEISSSSTDKYLKDQIAILKQLSLSKEEYDREIGIIHLVEQTSSSSPEDNEDDEGIVDYIIPSADILQSYNRYIQSYKIQKKYLHWYLSSFKLFSPVAESREQSTSQPYDHATKRKATSEETKFRMFVSRRLKELFVSNLEKHVSFASYLPIVFVFINVFEKYTVIENVEGMFTSEYIAEAEYELVSRLLSFDIPDDSETKNAIVLLALQTIINNHKVAAKDYIFEIRCEELLSIIDELFEIRESYKIYLNKINERLSHYGKSYNLSKYVSYFEDRFGYLPFKNLEKLFKQYYGDKTVTELETDCLIVKAKAQSLSNHMTVSPKVIKEGINYCVHFRSPTIFKLIIEKENVRAIHNGDPATSVEYIYDTIAQNERQVIKRLSGKTEEYKKINYK